jgi:HTH-like domain
VVACVLSVLFMAGTLLALVLAELAMERDVLKRSVVLGQGGDEVSVAAFIACQTTEHRVPHAVACRALGLSESWFYKWRNRPATARQQRRQQLADRIGKIFAESGGTYGSPRVAQELWAAGWRVSVNTVAQLMAELGLVARVRRRGAA